MPLVPGDVPQRLGWCQLDFTHAQRLLSTLPKDATVIDIGGAAAPFVRADYVIDAVPYEARNSGSDGNINQKLAAEQRFSADHWIQADLCDRTPWPIEDKAFDFAVCSHVLEDVRDPIWMCSEMQRIAKAGYIETPSRVVEQSKGVENPRHAGFYHHRWLVSKVGERRLEFRHKPHLLHSVNEAIVTHLGPTRRIRRQHAIVTLDWVDSFDAVEVLEFDEGNVIAELCDVAQAARKLPQLDESTGLPFSKGLQRRLFYARLRLGLR